MPGGLQLVERPGHLVRLDERVGTVQQQDVDVVGLQRSQRPLDRADQVLVGEVEVRTLADDAGLGLQGDLLAIGRGQLHGLGEAPLAAVQVAAVHVGVVEEVDPGVARRRDQGPDGVVIELGDPHQAEDDVGHLCVGGAEGDGSHYCSWSMATAPVNDEARCR